MNNLKFTYYPDPFLRRKAQPIEGKPTDDMFRLLEQMKQILVEQDGIGLAAQQVGLVMPLIVFGFPKQDGKYELVGVINPHIIERGKVTELREEGCLSFPKLYFPVERPKRIVAEGWFDDTKSFDTRELFDMAARVFCHESDHINGILYIDRVDGITRQRIKPHLQRIASKKQAPGQIPDESAVD